jgi:O-antigen ligase
MKTKYLAVYYTLLLLVMMTWTSQDQAPPMTSRIVFLIAVLLPGAFNRHGLFFVAIFCFWTISVNGYAYSYMPTMPGIYLSATAVILLIYKYKYNSLFWGGNIWFLLLLLLVFLSSLDSGPPTSGLLEVLLIIFLTHLLLPKADEQTIAYFQLAFMVITIVLSFYLITICDISSPEISSIGDKERVGWNDPNYMGMIIGMGVCVGVGCLLRFKQLNYYFIGLSIASILIAIPVMLMLASRGAILCLVVSVIFQLVMKTGNRRAKILMVIAGASFLYYLYNNEYFDLLEERFQNDDGSGSNRTTIWKEKWDGFTSYLDVPRVLFGVGWEKGLDYGAAKEGVKALGFHNDFLAFLVCYGIIGLGLFLTLLILPLRNIKQWSEKWTVVCANVLYLVAGCSTLEPFSLGNFTFYAFLIYTILLARVNNKLR